MADTTDMIRPRKLTGRMQVELLDNAASRADDTSISPGVRRWADGIVADMSMFDLAYICGVEIDALMDLEMEDLVKLVKDCRKENPLFFGMLERETKFTRDMMEKYPDLVQSFAASKLNGSGNPSPRLAEAGTGTG